MTPTSSPSGGWGTWGEELARRLVADLGAVVLRRFPRLRERDAWGVTEAAAERLVRQGPPGPGPLDAHVRRALFMEALPHDRRLFFDALGERAGEVERSLEVIRGRLRRLSERERDVLLSVFTLDDVADGDETSKVVLHAAVAQQMRWNTAHQNLSRAWRRLCDGLHADQLEWREVHRFVRAPTPLQLWIAAREYLDACSGRGAHAGPAFEAWTDAHEAHNERYAEWKGQGLESARRWRAFLAQLDASGVRPNSLFDPLVARCGDLGIDLRVVPARLRTQHTWAALLAGAPRPGPAERAAWRAFVRDHAFGAQVEAAFCEVERASVLSDAAALEVDAAYQRMIEAAAGRSTAGVRAKDELRRLLEAARWR